MTESSPVSPPPTHPDLSQTQGVQTNPFFVSFAFPIKLERCSFCCPVYGHSFLPLKETLTLWLLVVFILGAFLMRSAGVVMNDLADRSIDRKVQRTQQRPLASGALSPKQGLLVALLLLSLAAGLLLFLNPLAASLSPIAFFLAAIYPFSKRVIHIPQFILGAGLWMGNRDGMGRSAKPLLKLPMWLIFASTIFWAIAYDTIYALQDREDDRRIGVKSSAILFGSYTWLGVGIASALMLVCLGIAGWLVGLGLIFYGVLAAYGSILHSTSLSITKRRDPTRILLHV